MHFVLSFPVDRFRGWVVNLFSGDELRDFLDLLLKRKWDFEATIDAVCHGIITFS